MTVARQVNLNGTFYQIKDDLIHKTIYPWKAQVRSTGSREFSDFSSAEMEEWHDFRNGIGLESALPNESSRLWWTEGIDFSTARSAVLGPLVTAPTTPVITAPDITNANFEIDISPTSGYGWTIGATAGDDNWTQSTEQEHGDGTKSWKNTACSLDEYLTQSVTIAPKATYTVKVWVYSVDGTDKVKIFLSDGTSSSYGELVGTTGTWAQATNSITTAMGATSLEISIYIGQATAGDNVYVDDATITVTAITEGNVVKIIDFQSGTYAILDGAVFKWDGTDTWDIKLVFPNLLDAIVVTDATDEYLVVSSATDAVYTVDGATWLDFPDAKCMGYLAFYDTKLRALDTDGGTLHSSAANNIDGVWTEFNLTGQFGTVYDLFEGKLLSDGTPTLYFCGTQGLYTLNVTTETAYKQEVAYPPLTYAGHKGLYWNANVWVATGFGILKVAPSVATFVGPDLDDGLPSTYQGSIFDMVTVNNWLVYCVNKTSSSDKSSILKRNSSYGGNLQVYTSAADTAISCLHHSPSSLYTNGRLWFGEGTSVKYMMFPDTTSNVKQVSTYTYVDDSGYGKLPIFRSLAAIPKVALGVAAITKSCNANEYVEVYYGLNGAAPTTLLGTFNDSPRDTIATFNSGLGTAFYTIQFAIKLIRGATTTNSPELESLMFYWYATPSRISAWTFNVEAIGDEADRIFTEFEAIQDTVTLVAFYPSGDTAKTAYNVKLTSMPSREWWEQQGGKEGYFTCTTEEVFKG